MNQKINIQPSVFVPPSSVIHSINVQIINLVLFQGATIVVSLLDVNDCIIHNETLALNGDDYCNWSNDDTWLIDFVLEKLSLRKVNIDETLSMNLTNLDDNLTNLDAELN